MPLGVHAACSLRPVLLLPFQKARCVHLLLLTERVRLCRLTFAPCSAHLNYLVSASGRKTTNKTSDVWWLFYKWKRPLEHRVGPFFNYIYAH